jgi:hypothetical protein
LDITVIIMGGTSGVTIARPAGAGPAEAVLLKVKMDLAAAASSAEGAAGCSAMAI